MISKDRIKELMFDDIGFHSRAEKVNLGVASMNVMYYFASQLMKRQLPFILENNFEERSKASLFQLLNEYAYTAITVTLTGDYRTIYDRFTKRNQSPDRHRGHVVNDTYPEETPGKPVTPISYEAFIGGITSRGMDRFVANGPRIVVDTTSFDAIQMDALLTDIRRKIERLQHD